MTIFRWKYIHCCYTGCQIIDLGSKINSIGKTTNFNTMYALSKENLPTSDLNRFFFCAELLILDQKNLKIEGEIEGHNKEEKALTCSIASISNKLLSLNLKLYERKGCKENLDRENLHMQNYYTNMLKVCVLIVIPTPVLSF
jgi:hypothetical protein